MFNCFCNYLNNILSGSVVKKKKTYSQGHFLTWKIRMDQDKRDELSELVEELTTSGEPQLNEAKMKNVKKICKYESFCIPALHIYAYMRCQVLNAVLNYCLCIQAFH